MSIKQSYMLANIGQIWENYVEGQEAANGSATESKKEVFKVLD